MRSDSNSLSITARCSFGHTETPRAFGTRNGFDVGGESSRAADPFAAFVDHHGVEYQIAQPLQTPRHQHGDHADGVKERQHVGRTQKVSADGTRGIDRRAVRSDHTKSLTPLAWCLTIPVSFKQTEVEPVEHKRNDQCSAKSQSGTGFAERQQKESQNTTPGR